MAFSSLPQNLQDIISFNFDNFLKVFILMVCLILALVYLFYIKKQQKESPFLFVGLVRILFSVLAYCYLYTFPIMIFLLYPQVDTQYFLTLLMMAYVVLTVAFFIIFFVNIFVIGPLYLFSLLKVAPENKRVKAIAEFLYGKDWVVYNARNAKKND